MSIVRFPAKYTVEIWLFARFDQTMAFERIRPFRPLSFSRSILCIVDFAPEPATASFPETEIRSYRKGVPAPHYFCQ